ncbi:hypothetical protein D9756_003408 [Leucocoprinus leucothites]|uniref:Uncharacterized protein n=1 Tax=Leucocoprinus leucothites TaxID=201217 RepID=A0A8H5G703_9AGAR|nr:hypothetical protein D9756_003408 [Leucoagaricus leucothites]
MTIMGAAIPRCVDIDDIDQDDITIAMVGQTQVGKSTAGGENAVYHSPGTRLPGSSSTTLLGRTVCLGSHNPKSAPKCRLSEAKILSDMAIVTSSSRITNFWL